MGIVSAPRHVPIACYLCEVAQVGCAHPPATTAVADIMSCGKPWARFHSRVGLLRAITRCREVAVPRGHDGDALEGDRGEIRRRLVLTPVAVYSQVETLHKQRRNRWRLVSGIFVNLNIGR